MANNVIIGLGGTGGKIIRSLRKMTHQMHQGEIPDSPRVKCLYVDSSDEHMRQDDPDWKVIGGKSVQLGKAEQLHISGMNLREILENLGAYPGIRSWIGSRDSWKEIIQSQDGAQLFAAQKRRLGRFLFAPQATKFNDRIAAIVGEVRQGNNAETVFHVCAGLAGGTGSGTIVDVISQVRKTFTDSKAYRIFLYLLLPEENPNPNWKGHNYWPNGYAALTELNALSVGKYKPFDITGESKLAGKDGRIDLQDPFNGGYLFTNQNASGYQIDVDKQVPEMVATFLYHKIYSAEKVGEANWQLNRIENFELKSQGKIPESGVCADAGSGKSGKEGSKGEPERSRRFMAFGIKQIAYPEEEIRDYITHAFARQGALQLAYGNWDDDKGYLDEPKNISVSEYVRQPDVLVKWKISDDHISLSTGVLSSEISNKEWKPIENDWATILAIFKSDIREHQTENKEGWMDELTKLCDKRFREGFRKMGVINFYDGKIRDKADHVREIVRVIEQDLLTQWKTNGQFNSLCDISRLLEGLILFLDEKHGLQLARVEKLSKEMAVTQARIKQQDEEWAKIGVLSSMVGKHEKVFEARTLNMQSLYVLRTRKESLRFSIALLKDLAQEVQILRASVDRAFSLVNKSTKHFLEQKEARCRDERNMDLNQQLIRFYDPKHVREVCRGMETDKDTQKAQTARLRAALFTLLGQNPTFTKFTQQLTESQIRETMEAVCKESVEDAHTKTVQEMRNREPLFGVNVLDKIEKHFGSDDAGLRQFIHDVTGKAETFLTSDRSEQSKDGLPGQLPDFDTWLADFTVILPKSSAPFEKRIREEFKAACKDPKFAPRDGRPHEIVIINTSICIPLRTIAPVRKLRQEYDAIINRGGDRSRLELHTEDWPEGVYPDLYLQSAREMAKNTLPLLLLGLALNCLSEDGSNKKGRKLSFIFRDPDTGLEVETIELKSDLVESVEEIEPIHAVRIEQEVRRLLKAKDLDRVKAKEKFVTAIQAEQAQVKATHGATSNQNKELMSASKRALELLSE